MLNLSWLLHLFNLSKHKHDFNLVNFTDVELKASVLVANNIQYAQHILKALSDCIKALLNFSIIYWSQLC